MSFAVRLAYGLPLAVGMDMSTTQWFKEVIEAGTEAVDPEDGSKMCRSWWLFTDTEDMTLAAKADEVF